MVEEVKQEEPQPVFTQPPINVAPMQAQMQMMEPEVLNAPQF